jgi:hypothetical protein
MKGGDKFVGQPQSQTAISQLPGGELQFDNFFTSAATRFLSEKIFQHFMCHAYNFSAPK